MAKYYFPAAAAAALFLFGSISCSKEKLAAKKPVYLSIPDIFVETDYANQGTSHQRITTVWILPNNTIAGAFELPCTVPVHLNEGKNSIRLLPGINLNGVSATRAVYSGLRALEFELDYTPSGREVADTIVIPLANRTTTYSPFVTLNVVENFDNAGLSLEKTSRSDTVIKKTSDSSDVFINPDDPSENNGAAGVLYTTSDRSFAEVSTADSYNFPRDGSNVYLELNYKCTIPFNIGVIGATSSGYEQRSTIIIYPREDWNKIYIDLVSEVTAINASEFKVYISAEHDDDLETGKVFLDNLKLVY